MAAPRWCAGRTGAGTAGAHGARAIAAAPGARSGGGSRPACACPRRTARSVRPEALGTVHRGVGISQQVRRAVCGAVGERDADAHRRHHLRPPEARRGGRALERPLGELDGLALVAQVLGDDDELVAAEARTVSSRRTQPASRWPATSRSSPVSWPSPSFTTPMKIGAHHGAAFGQGRRRLVEPVHGERAVQELGERVVEGEEPQLFGVCGPVECERRSARPEGTRSPPSGACGSDGSRRRGNRGAYVRSRVRGWETPRTTTGHLAECELT